MPSTFAPVRTPENQRFENYALGRFANAVLHVEELNRDAFRMPPSATAHAWFDLGQAVESLNHALAESVDRRASADRTERVLVFPSSRTLHLSGSNGKADWTLDQFVFWATWTPNAPSA